MFKNDPGPREKWTHSKIDFAIYAASLAKCGSGLIGKEEKRVRETLISREET